ncbi:MAG: polysaccharide deacetylase family protein [Clostridia bacterium]|nr:polysaccharide deacetylase family protein [Clostridia bacterium]
MRKHSRRKGILAAVILLLLAAGSVCIAYFGNPQTDDPENTGTEQAQSSETFSDTTQETVFSSETTDPEYSDVTGTETQSEPGTDTDTDTTDTTDTDEKSTGTTEIPLKEILGHITPPPDGSPKKIAFTFDDGPYTPVTRGIVDEFAKYGGHCTFFVVGNRIYGTQKEAMKYAFDQGNEIAIHAYTHNAYYNTCSNSVYQFEIEKTAEEILNVTGKAPTLMRPVGGSITNERVANSPYSVILWNLDTKDWKYRNADTVARSILNSVTAGDIILLHDIYPSSLEAIKMVLPLLKEYGYEFVTVSELLGEEMQAGKKYSNAY